MNNLYKKIKPYHIQQTHRASCSLASYLVVENAITQKRKTQAEFRREILTYNLDWNHRIEVKVGTISCDILKGYCEKSLSRLGKKFQVERLKISFISMNRFTDILYSVNNSTNNYIIFNFNSHYSPLGEFDIKNNQITILDVDGLRNYDNEVLFLEGEGELKFETKKFYSLLKRQSRSFLLIKILE